MREIRHWHVVEEKEWQRRLLLPLVYLASGTSNRAGIPASWSACGRKKRLLEEAKRTLLESMTLLDDRNGIADLTKLLGGKPR